VLPRQVSGAEVIFRHDFGWGSSSSGFPCFACDTVQTPNPGFMGKETFDDDELPAIDIHSL
jgi:hypothetical protein